MCLTFAKNATISETLYVMTLQMTLKSTWIKRKFSKLWVLKDGTRIVSSMLIWSSDLMETICSRIWKTFRLYSRMDCESLFMLETLILFVTGWEYIHGQSLWNGPANQGSTRLKWWRGSRKLQKIQSVKFARMKTWHLSKSMKLDIWFRWIR